MSLPPKRTNLENAGTYAASGRGGRACPVRLSPAFGDEALASALQRSNDQLIPATLVMDIHFSEHSSTVLHGLPALLDRVDPDRKITQIRCYFGTAAGPEPVRWLEHLVKVFSERALTRDALVTVQVPFALLNQPWIRPLSQLPITELQIDCHDAIDTGQLLWQRNLGKVRRTVGVVSFCVGCSIPESTLLRLLCATPDSINVSTGVLAAVWLRQQMCIPASARELQRIFRFSTREIMAKDYDYFGLGAYRRHVLTEARPPVHRPGPVDLFCLAPGGLIRLGEWVFRVVPDLLGAGQLVAGGGCLSNDTLSQEELAMSLLQDGHSNTASLPLKAGLSGDTDRVGHAQDRYAVERSASSHFSVSDTQLFAIHQ